MKFSNILCIHVSIDIYSLLQKTEYNEGTHMFRLLNVKFFDIKKNLCFQLFICVKLLFFKKSIIFR